MTHQDCERCILRIRYIPFAHPRPRGGRYDLGVGVNGRGEG